MESSQHAKQPSKRVTEARAAAQRAKLDAQAERRRESANQPAKASQGKQKQASLLAKRRASTTIERTIADYLLDHEVLLYCSFSNTSL